MFKLEDSFKTCDDNLQPYTMRAERHTEILDMHTGVDERGFSMRSVGNRYIFNTPSLKDFEFKMVYAYTFMEEYNPAYNIIWGYDTKLRTGYGLRFEYSLDGGMTVSYIKLDRMNTVTAAKVSLPEFKAEEEKDVELYFKASGTGLTGRIGDFGFAFNIDDFCGSVVIERDNFIGELIIREYCLSSDDEFEEEAVLPEQTVEIPLTDGGDIPYIFSYAIVRVENLYFLDAKLFGGTASRKVNREDRPGQYVAEKDFMDTAYTVVRSGDAEKKFYLFKGEKIICDPNIFWDCQKRFFGHPDFPIEGRFLLKDITDADSVSFGYNNLRCTGYSVQAGGPSEFIFDRSGKLLYSGDALGESIFELFSPENKFAASLIPDNAYKREEIIRHLALNHYFHKDEEVALTFSLKTRLNPEYINIKAEIRDVYDSETLKELEGDVTVGKWEFGYNQVLVKTVSHPMELGVYRAVFTVYYGDEAYKRYDKVFEVFDKDSSVSPAAASGLPYVFSMPNEQKWLMRNTFDLWTPKASCDIGHFISCITDTPIEAEERKPWQVIKPFGREWFAWISDRTCLDWSIESHKEVAANCDYLYVPAKTEVFPLRNDLYLAKTYQNPEFRKYLHEFMDLNPQFAEKLLYKKTESKNYSAAPIFDESGTIPVYKDFTYEHLENLMEVCHEEWMEFALKKLLENFREQNEELKKINPNFKRTAYGPFNQYVTPTLSYHTIKSFGNLPYNTLSDDVYTGFAIFEDYPGSCAYQTYRGAFAVMTILLYCPELVLYPEQYKGGPGGCIDGAVKFSHAPMGAYDMPQYFNTTHAFEFVFNTPRKTPEGYRYWNTYGFHRPDFPAELWNRLVREWKTAVDCRPAKPMRTMAMITEYYDGEDIFDGSIIEYHGHTTLYNRSEEAHGYIYECAREAGLNAPFAMKFDSLDDLDESECDVLVVPTLKYADKEKAEKIRELYGRGVALFAVSDVDGLEDIFGVKAFQCKKHIDTLVCSDGRKEEIYPNDADFKYVSDGAEVILASADGTPVLMRNGNAVLLNAAVSTLGHECFLGAAGKGRKNVSVLLRETLKKVLRDISDYEIIGDNVGITYFEAEDGRRHLLCIDYSEYTNSCKNEKLAVVKLNGCIKDISSERDFCTVRDLDGNICELRFNIKVHESVMFDLN